LSVGHTGDTGVNSQLKDSNIGVMSGQWWHSVHTFCGFLFIARNYETNCSL